MPNRQLTITGLTTKKGEFGIYNKGQLNDFCKKNPDKRLIITVQVEEKGSKNAMLAYFNAKVIPDWIKHFFEIGEVVTKEQIEKYLRNICPITQIKSLSELSRDEMTQFLDLVKIESLKECNLFIEEPSIL